MTREMNKTLIDEVTRHLIKAYNPLSIYLFGSYVWGIPDMICVTPCPISPWGKVPGRADRGVG